MTRLTESIVSSHPKTGTDTYRGGGDGMTAGKNDIRDRHRRWATARSGKTTRGTDTPDKEGEQDA